MYTCKRVVAFNVESDSELRDIEMNLHCRDTQVLLVRLAEVVKLFDSHFMELREPNSFFSLRLELISRGQVSA